MSLHLCSGWIRTGSRLVLIIRRTVISDYLDILSAAQATTSHFSTLDTTYGTHPLSSDESL